MKQTDNRQKQQIQLRAQKVRLEKNILDGKDKGHSEAPEPHDPSSGSEEKNSKTPPQIYHADPKVGRNEPCPCGSGKKYKKCCLATGK